MALIKCPECGKDVSDKASNCIHCGYPIEELKQEKIEEINAQGDNLRAEKRYIDALDCYIKAANLGSSHAQLWIGNIYSRGLGVEVDNKKAVQWYLKAAEQNHTDALNNLGVAYTDGKGVAKDYEKAEAYYLKAIQYGNQQAKKNYAIIANNLGVAYADGKGVTKDYAKAEEYYLKAIKYGNEQAHRNYDALKKLKAQPIMETPSYSSQNTKAGRGSVGLLIAICAILFLLFIGIVGGDDDDRGTRTCAWCNGTGYSANGAQSVEEYVFKKKPCKHCGGDGEY